MKLRISHQTAHIEGTLVTSDFKFTVKDNPILRGALSILRRSTHETDVSFVVDPETLAEQLAVDVTRRTAVITLKQPCPPDKSLLVDMDSPAITDSGEVIFPLTKSRVIDNPKKPSGRR